MNYRFNNDDNSQIIENEFITSPPKIDQNNKSRMSILNNNNMLVKENLFPRKNSHTGPSRELVAIVTGIGGSTIY